MTFGITLVFAKVT